MSIILGCLMVDFFFINPLSPFGFLIITEDDGWDDDIYFDELLEDEKYGDDSAPTVSGSGCEDDDDGEKYSDVYIAEASPVHASDTSDSKGENFRSFAKTVIGSDDMNLALFSGDLIDLAKGFLFLDNSSEFKDFKAGVWGLNAFFRTASELILLTFSLIKSGW